MNKFDPCGWTVSVHKWKPKRSLAPGSIIVPNLFLSTDDGDGVIKKLKSGKYRLYTADGSRPLGPPTTEEKAATQERAIQAAKRRRK